jgi:hypothetical protein
MLFFSKADESIVKISEYVRSLQIILNHEAYPFCILLLYH